MPKRLYAKQKHGNIRWNAKKRFDIPVKIFAINKHSIIRLEKWRLWKDALELINWVSSRAIRETKTEPNEIPINTFW
jgi:hypothetical protein